MARREHRRAGRQSRPRRRRAGGHARRGRSSSAGSSSTTSPGFRASRRANAPSCSTASRAPAAGCCRRPSRSDVSTPEGRFVREMFLSIARMQWEQHRDAFARAANGAVSNGCHAHAPLRVREGDPRRRQGRQGPPARVGARGGEGRPRAVHPTRARRVVERACSGGPTRRASRRAAVTSGRASRSRTSSATVRTPARRATARTSSPTRTPRLSPATSSTPPTRRAASGLRAVRPRCCPGWSGVRGAATDARRDRRLPQAARVPLQAPPRVGRVPGPRVGDARPPRRPGVRAVPAPLQRRRARGARGGWGPGRRAAALGGAERELAQYLAAISIDDVGADAVRGRGP